MVVAGGAGPLHACMIGQELELPLLIVPRESSIFCAAGMLMSDLKHDFVRSCVGRLDAAEIPRIERLVGEMMAEGAAQLARERIAEPRFVLHFDCRYTRQYHEVSFPVPLEALQRGEIGRIRNAFHAEHNRLYGYSLEDQGTPIELINVRVQAVGVTDKPAYRRLERDGDDPGSAQKGERRIVLPESGLARTVPVYDGDRLRFGNRIAGPAVIEQVNTSFLVSSSYDCICDAYGSFAAYRKGMSGAVSPVLQVAS